MNTCISCQHCQLNNDAVGIRRVIDGTCGANIDYIGTHRIISTNWSNGSGTLTILPARSFISAIRITDNCDNHKYAPPRIIAQRMNLFVELAPSPDIDKAIMRRIIGDVPIRWKV